MNEIIIHNKSYLEISQASLKVLWVWQRTVQVGTNITDMLLVFNVKWCN